MRQWVEPRRPGGVHDGAQTAEDAKPAKQWNCDDIIAFNAARQPPPHGAAARKLDEEEPEGVRGLDVGDATARKPDDKPKAENADHGATVDQVENTDEETSSFDARSFFDFIEPVSVNNVDGILAELRDFILHHSPIYQNKAMALGSAISIISALAGRTLASPTACPLNLYVALIAPTGGGKNFPLNAPGKVFAALDARAIVTGSFASAAAIEEQLNINPTVLAAIDEFGNQLLSPLHRKSSFDARASPWWRYPLALEYRLRYLPRYERCGTRWGKDRSIARTSFCSGLRRTPNFMRRLDRVT